MTLPAPRPPLDRAGSVAGTIGLVRTRESVQAWLDRLERILALPARAAREVREELEAHLLERSIDLMQSGLPEAQAVHAAIAELGDTAELALRYREAHRTTPWRSVMKAMVMIGVGAAMVLGASALIPAQSSNVPQPDGVRVYAPSGQGWAEPAGRERKSPALSIDNQSLLAVLELIAEGQDLRLYLHEMPLQESGIELNDTPITLKTGEISLLRLFTLLNDRIGLNASPEIDFRVNEGHLEVATREYFDRKECSLAVFDIRELTERVTEAEEILQLLNSVIEPDAWVENGGDLANARVVAGKLFVNAPPRIQQRVSWVLEQLEDGEQAALPARDEHVQVFPLKHTLAPEVGEVAQRIFEGVGPEIIADTRTNALIATGDEPKLASLSRLLDLLDREVGGDDPPASGR